MSVSAEQLVEELKMARRGRGLFHADVRRIGTGLREVCGVGPTDLPAEVRAKAVSRLRDVAGTLPADLAEAAMVALGIHPEVRNLPQLQLRVDWLAARLQRDTRTARRRIDEACALLAANAVVRPTAATGRGRDWYVASYHAVLVLDAGAPTALERRTVVAEADGLDRLVLGLTVPRVSAGEHDVELQMLYGGVLAGKDRATASRFRAVVDLPAPLRSGERHEYGMLVRIPPRQRMRPHYVYTPSGRCDRFDLRVRFDRRHPPEGVWRVVDAYPRDLDEEPTGQLLPVDRAGEVHVAFDEILPGHGYGVRWA